MIIWTKMMIIWTTMMIKNQMVDYATKTMADLDDDDDGDDDDYKVDNGV